MKKKQVIIRIMFIVILIGMVAVGYQVCLKYTIDTVTTTTSEITLLYNKEMTDDVSKQIETLSSELNTKVDSINTENVKLQKVIEAQSKQLEEFSKALENVGITFQ